MKTPRDIIDRLKLVPHPEGGYYRRTYSNAGGTGDRGRASVIYYLLEKPGFALWHRFDADELWCWHAGAPMTLEIGSERSASQTLRLGPAVIDGELPQVHVPAHHWQRAKSEGDWTLVSCIASPEFQFEELDLHIEPQPAGH